MKTSTWILIIVGIFILAAGVVAYTLMETQKTLKDAKATADSAAVVTGDVKAFGMTGKKVWTDLKGIFG